MTRIEMDTMRAIESMNRKMKDQRQIDWEQRRYEIAKGWLCATATIPQDMDERCWNAVRIADALIAELKKGGEK